jgi:hypothetical protein
MQVARLFSLALAVFCSHEWARRVQGRRVYLECVRCLRTTRGVEVSRRGGGPGRTPEAAYAARPLV